MKKIGEKLNLVGWGLKILVRHGWPRVLTHFAAGVGDELMLTAMIRELRTRGAPRVWVMSSRPELYRHNPDIASVVPVDARIIPLARRCGARIIEPRYTLADVSGNLRPPPAHMITCLMATAGLTGRVLLRPVLKLTPQERNTAAPWAGSIVIQPTIRSAARPNDLKEWWPERWQQVVDALRSSYRIVQVGGETDPLLIGAEDLRGHHLSLREVAAILSHARLFVGYNSGFMHLARAVDCRSVILLGGHANTAQAGYDGNIHLVRSPACAPCWRYTGCELDRQCMRDITPSEAIEAIEEALAQRVPLPDTVIELTLQERERVVGYLQG